MKNHNDFCFRLIEFLILLAIWVWNFLNLFILISLILPSNLQKPKNHEMQEIGPTVTDIIII